MGQLEPSSLRWEGHGAPSGVGVCLSGGGLRAASFALGAVQALQKERGLLFGPRSADHLAAVSGGSYLAGAFVLNADTLSKTGTDPYGPPLARDSPEAEYVVKQGSYLKNWGSASRFAGTGALNLVAFAVLFAWTAALLNCTALLADVLPGDRLRPSEDELVLSFVAATTWLIGGRLMLRGLYDDGGWDLYALRFLGWIIVLLGAGSLLAAMERLGALSDLAWWGRESRWLLAIGVCSATAGLAFALARRWPRHIASRAASWLAARIPAAIGVVAFCLVATALNRLLDRGVAEDASDAEVIQGFAWFFGVLILGALMIRVAAWASLHRLYRDQLATCFSVRRSGGTVEPVGATGQKLSELAPPERGTDGSFPRLLICATANVVWDPKRPRRTFFVTWRRGRKAFASYVYSHDRCGIPGVADAWFSTEKLEDLKAVSGLLCGEEELVSLMTAVASTGAAVSPAMGRRTSAVFRPLIALANLRLGRWLPNPFSREIHRLVHGDNAQKRLKRLRGLGSGYDEFVPEIFGLHRADAPRVYISDGGHYDNLGLLALLHARCGEIWCVDAEADSKGRAQQLGDVIKLAREELDVTIEVPPNHFRAEGDGILRATHAVGRVIYPNGAGEGTIVVIKLGLRSDSPDPLKEYRRTHKPFPYHDTFKPPWDVMWYDEARMRNYACVGYDNAAAACGDSGAPAAQALAGSSS